MGIQNILLVINDPLYGLQLEESLSILGYTIVDQLNSYQNALDFVSLTDIELVIIDIPLEGPQNGLKLAEEHAFQNLPVILLTHHDSSEIYQKVVAVSHPLTLYLVKPFHIHSLDSIIKILAQHPIQEPKFIQGNSRSEFIAIKDIIYIEVEHNYIFIQTAARRYAFKKSLTQLKLQLPANRFLQVHRSFLVNKKFIKKIDLEKNIVEIAGYTLPLSRRMKHNLLSKNTAQHPLS
ncbi:response regulator [Runella sp. CRIBMP]|uniref:LytR/AlgR family response regulator transcription factor n=1 Tax=Runella sp. CRIBMP TaxID=2683261 RepID=UPI0014128AED|nr:LytTR family DNA-binding domain-containing protein [Runella sp. CRIBMP]NBB20504.1 response regulator [Runella sp. CRIBMP]